MKEYTLSAPESKPIRFGFAGLRAALTALKCCDLTFDYVSHSQTLALEALLNRRNEKSQPTAEIAE